MKLSKVVAGAGVLAVAGAIALTIAPILSSPAADSAPPATRAAEAASPTESAAPEPLTELPDWALESTPWIVYPEGFRCMGTEGCPNDYRAAFGEPGTPLPVHVEVYDPERHDGRLVWPREQSPVMTEGNTERLDGDRSGVLPGIHP